MVAANQKGSCQNLVKAIQLEGIDLVDKVFFQVCHFALRDSSVFRFNAIYTVHNG